MLLSLKRDGWFVKVMCKNRLIRWFYVFRCTWMGLYKGVCIKTKLLRCTIYGFFLPKKFTVIMVLNILKAASPIY